MNVELIQLEVKVPAPIPVNLMSAGAPPPAPPYSVFTPSEFILPPYTGMPSKLPDSKSAVVRF